MEEDIDLCRVAIMSSRRRVDLSLPIDVPFADLLPTILRYAGRDLADAGVSHGGWVLQRVDDVPFDASLTPAQVGLRHGETLFLRPAGRRIPDLSAVDVSPPQSASAGPATSSWPWGYFLGLVAAASAAAAITVLHSSQQWHLPGAAELAVCLVLLGGGLAGLRISSENTVGLVFGLSALPHAFLAGLFGTHASADLARPDVARGFGALAVAALICAVVLRDSWGIFAGITAAAVAGLVTTGIAVAAHRATSAQIAAVTLTVLAFGIAVRLASRLAKRSGRSQEKPGPNWASAERWSNAAVLALAITGVTAEAFLAFSRKDLGSVTCAIAAAAFIFQSRTFTTRLHRVVVLSSGIAGLIVLAVAGSTKHSGVAVLAVSLALLVAGALVASLTALSWRHLQRAMPAYLGSMFAVLGSLCALGLVPLAVRLLGI